MFQPALNDRENAASAPRAAWRGRSFLDALTRPAQLLPLTLLSILPLTLASYALLAPGVVFSREMTADLLFNLEGAWALFEGRILNVDVHDPLGILPFLLTEFGPAPKIVTLDSVDPLPFVLGLKPPRGGDLWYDPVFPSPSAAAALGDADVVLIPKFFGATTELALTRYGGYLREHFLIDRETRCWIVYRRENAEGIVSQRN